MLHHESLPDRVCHRASEYSFFIIMPLMGLLIMGLATDRDVLKLLTCYRRIAGSHLGQELDTTVADMRTGNYENALLHFQNLVGSTMLSDIVRGLIETLRGDDQQMYFKMLVFDMR